MGPCYNGITLKEVLVLMILFYNLTYALSLFILIAITAYAWLYKDKPGAKVMIATMVFLVLWNTTSLFEVYTSDLETKLFWRNAQQISGFLLPYLIFYFATSFIENQGVRKVAPYLIFFPVLFTVLVYTNPYHGLVRNGYSLVEIADGYGFLNVEVSALGAVNVMLNAGFVFVAVALLMIYYRKAIGKVRQQIRIMVIAMVLTVGLVMFNNFYLRPDGTYIMTSIFYVPGITMLAYALFRHEMFSASPLSKDRLLEAMVHPIFVCDQAGRIIEHNNAGLEFVQAAGYDSVNSMNGIHDLFIKPLYVRMQDMRNQRNIQEIALQMDDGLRYFIIHFHTLTQESAYTGMLLHLEDVTAKKSYELSLKRRADQDQMTGLLNRSTFQTTYEAMPEAGRVMILMDADDFKRVNDTYGHHSGDVVLKTLAKRFNHIKDKTCITGRLGGEEFAVACYNMTRDDALALAERIRRSVSDTPIEIQGGKPIALTISVGVSLDEDGSKPFDEIRNEADTALYQAKGRQKNRVEVYRQ